MKIKKLPNVLALHLKRFKQEDPQKSIKLAYRVAFPFELRLFNTVDDSEDADRLYELFGIVVHIGKYVPNTHNSYSFQLVAQRLVRLPIIFLLIAALTMDIISPSSKVWAHGWYLTTTMSTRSQKVTFRNTLATQTLGRRTSCTTKQPI